MNAYDVLVSNQKFAVIGMSDDTTRYSYRVFNKLLDYDKTVYGINPRLNHVDEHTIYQDLTSIEDDIDIAVLMVNPKIGIHYLESIKNKNIPYLWIQPGAQSDEIISKAKTLGLKVIESCVLREYKAKEIKAVISDLDETLLQKDKTISEVNLRGIQALKEKGIYFIMATGRPFYSIRETLDTLDLYGPEDLSISYNGGMIHHNQTKEILSVNKLDNDLANWIYQLGLDEGVCMHIYVENQTYAYNMNDEEREHVKNFEGMVEQNHQSLSFLKDQPILKVLFQNLDMDYLHSLEDKIPSEIKDKLEISYSSSRYMEFNPKGVSKGAAVEFVAKYLNIKIDDILAIGDNLNDLGMLKISGVSGAPLNAHEAIKEVAIYNSNKNYDEGAVYDILKKTKVI